MHSGCVEQTRELGLRVGRRLRAGDLLLLSGPLGAGKTTFVAGLARGAGSPARVMSPTFGLARSYRGKRLTLHHIDLYRVAEQETGDVGLEEFLRDERAAAVVEWPESGRAYYPADRLELRFAHAGTARRRIALRGTGPRGRRLLAGLR